MVGIIREQRLACTFIEALKNKWWLDDETSPWRKHVATLVHGSGKVDYLTDHLTNQIASDEKVVVATDLTIWPKGLQKTKIDSGYILTSF